LDIQKSDYSKNDTFTCAVNSIIIKLEGITAHAGEPMAIASIITQFNTFIQADISKENYCLITILFILHGKSLRVWNSFTVRSDSNGKMRTIETTLEHIAHESQMNTA
jgi:hypothetical protein